MTGGTCLDETRLDLGKPFVERRGGEKVSWEIKVWHEEIGDQIRLVIEAGSDVPEDVISTVTGSYWAEEVQFGGDDWEDDDDLPPRLQG